MEFPDVADISRAIQARHLLTPIAQAYAPAPEERSGAASRRMDRQQFAYAPVVTAGRILGLFGAHSANPRTAVGRAMRPLSEALLVSGDTTLQELAAHLAEEPFLFVVRGRRIVGFVTPADMGSAPARTHYYLQLAGLEMLLADLVRSRFPDQAQAVDLLGSAARDRQRALATQLRGRDEFLDDVAAMSLVDLVNVAGKLEDFRAAAAAAGVRGWQWLLGGLPEFRNDVMHPVRTLPARQLPGWRSWRTSTSGCAS